MFHLSPLVFFVIISSLPSNRAALCCNSLQRLTPPKNCQPGIIFPDIKNNLFSFRKIRFIYEVFNIFLK